MLKLNSIKVDVSAEHAGQYIEIPEWPGVSLGVRSIEYGPYKMAWEQLVQKYARRYKGRSAPAEVRDADVGKLLATHILFDWKGIEPEYTAEYAEEFLGNTSGRELAKQVLWASGKAAEVEAEFTDDAVKN